MRPLVGHLVPGLVAVLLTSTGCSLLLGIEDLPGDVDAGVIEPPDAAPTGDVNLQIDREGYDFGAGLVAAGAGPTATFTVTNLATEPTPALLLSFTGAAASEFSVEGGTCDGATVGPGDTCTVEVAFAPTVEGLSEAPLLITGGAAGGLEALLRGEGVAGGTIQVSPTSRDFGAIAVDTATGPVTFTIANPDAAVSSGAITTRLLGQDAHSFALTTDGCLTVSIGATGTCAAQVRFAALTPTDARAWLVVTTPASGSAVVPLIARGVTPDALAVVPPSSAFVTTAVGGQSAEVMFTVTNNGAVTTGPIEATLPDTRFIVTMNGCAAGLTPSTTCQMRLRFQPDEAGPIATPLLLAAGTAIAVVPLTGTATSPAQLEAEVTDVVFPPSFVSSSHATQVPIRVWNSGDTTTGAITVVSSNATEFQVAAGCGGGIAPRQLCTIMIDFRPNAVGARTSTLTITGAAGGTRTVALTGDATAQGTLGFNPASSGGGPFTATDVGSVTPRTYSIRNNGVATTGTLQVAIVGTTHFTLLNDTCTGATLAPSAVCGFDARFAPTSLGVHTGSVTVSDGALTTSRPLVGTAAVDVNVTATGPVAAGTLVMFPGELCSTFPCPFKSSFASISLRPASHPAGQFSGWTVADCTGTGTCTVALSTLDRTVTGAFMATGTVSVAKTGTGKALVTSDRGGVVCGPLCSGVVPSTGLTRFFATAPEGTLTTWTGGTIRGSTCDLPVNAGTNLAVGPLLAYPYAGADGGDDRGNGVLVTATGTILATGSDFRAADDTDLWLMEVTSAGVVRSARNNYLELDEGFDVAVRASDGRVYTGGQQGAAAGANAPWMVGWTFPVAPNPPSPTTLDGAADGGTIRYTRIVSTPMGSLYAIGPTDDDQTMLRRWASTDAVSGTNIDPRSWVAIVPDAVDSALLVGTAGTDVVIGKLGVSVAFDFTQTRVTAVEDAAVDLALSPTGTLVVLVEETVAGRGTNVRIVELSADGTSELRTRAYDSGPDSADRATAIAVDAAGQVFVLGSSRGTLWLRKYTATLTPVWSRSIPGTDVAVHNITVDLLGNVILVGDEVVDGQRDAFVRKVGP